MTAAGSETLRRGLRLGLPRALECVLAGLALALATPLLALLALAIACSSRGGILFCQPRVGQGGQRFTLYKFRSMRAGVPGAAVTAARDPRITPLGRWLRASKLDELPELWNVVVGDLALVGPRPEVPAHVDLADPLWQEVLRERPGLTHPVTLRLRREEELLATVPGPVDVFYRERLLPYKLRAYLEHRAQRSWQSDFRVLWDTLVQLLGGRDLALSPQDLLAEIAP